MITLLILSILFGGSGFGLSLYNFLRKPKIVESKIESTIHHTVSVEPSPSGVATCSKCNSAVEGSQHHGYWWNLLH